MDTIDYTSVTEVSGYNVTAEQIQRMYTRYRFAREYCTGKDVLEVACGSGQGLGYLAKKAKSVAGGDYDRKLVQCANEYYKGKIEVRQLDAHNLPFADRSFDVIILYEAIYYLSNPERFVAEARRVLRDRGLLIICSANRDWEGFNPSPYSIHYFSVPELFNLLHAGGFDAETFADCPARSGNSGGKILTIIKKIAVRLHLIPKTMKGKEKLKRLLYGKLRPLPPEITDGIADYTHPVPIFHNAPNRDYKVIFAVGHAN